MYFQPHHCYFVNCMIEEVVNFDTELQPRQFLNGWIINMQDELGYQEIFQHKF